MTQTFTIMHFLPEYVATMYHQYCIHHLTNWSLDSCQTHTIVFSDFLQFTDLQVSRMDSRMVESSLTFLLAVAQSYRDCCWETVVKTCVQTLKIICWRKSKVYAERISVCYVAESLAEHGKLHAAISMTP